MQPHFFISARIPGQLPVFVAYSVNRDIIDDLLSGLKVEITDFPPYPVFAAGEAIAWQSHKDSLREIEEVRQGKRGQQALAIHQAVMQVMEAIEGPATEPTPPGGSQAVAAAPVKLLANWREILITLGMNNNREDKQKVSRLNRTCNGPIVIPGKGKQPIADKAKLLKWWDRLEIELQDRANQARGAAADAESHHAYGRMGRAAPAIGGEVKRRRKDWNP